MADGSSGKTRFAPTCHSRNNLYRLCVRPRRLARPSHDSPRCTPSSAAEPHHIGLSGYLRHRLDDWPRAPSAPSSSWGRSEMSSRRAEGLRLSEVSEDPAGVDGDEGDQSAGPE